MDIIKDLLYSTKRPLYSLFREVSPSNNLDLVGFIKLVRKVSRNSMGEEEIEQAFQQGLNKFTKPTDHFKNYLTFQEFEKLVTVHIPNPD